MSELNIVFHLKHVLLSFIHQAAGIKYWNIDTACCWFVYPEIMIETLNIETVKVVTLLIRSLSWELLCLVSCVCGEAECVQRYLSPR